MIKIFSILFACFLLISCKNNSKPVTKFHYNDIALIKNGFYSNIKVLIKDCDSFYDSEIHCLVYFDGKLEYFPESNLQLLKYDSKSLYEESIENK